MPTAATLLALILAWTAFAVWPGLSEPLKLAGLAVGVALLLVRAAPMRARGWTAAALAAVAIKLTLSAALALEPAAWLGSLARAQGWLTGICLLPLALASACLQEAARERVSITIAWIGCALAAYALWQRAGLDVIAWVDAVPERPFATLGNANVLAGWMLLAIPITTLLALRAGSRRGLWFALAGLQLAGLLASGSRSAVLALLMAGALIYGLRRNWRWPLAILVGCGVLAWVLLAVRPASVQDRSELWRAGASAYVSAAPLVDLQGHTDEYASARRWIGFGPDLQAAPLQAALAQSERREGARGWQADRAHQGVLDSLLQLGLLGTAALAGLAALVTRALWRRRAEPAAVALAIALLAWCLSLQAGFALTGDRTLAWLLIGWALTPAVPPGAPSAAGKGARALLALALVAAAAGALGLLPLSLQNRLNPALAGERAFLAGQRSYAHALTLDPPQAAAELRASAQAFEQAVAWRPYDRDAALAAASAWVEAAHAGRDATALAPARRWLDAAASLDQAEPRLATVRARIDAVAPEIH